MRFRSVAAAAAILGAGVAVEAAAQAYDPIQDKYDRLQVNEVGRDYIECVYIAKYDGPSVLSNHEAAKFCEEEARLFFAATASSYGRRATFGLQRFPGDKNAFFRTVSKEMSLREEAR